MADRLLPSQLEQANHISENNPPYPPLHSLQGHNDVRRVTFHTTSLIIVVYSCVVLQNPHVAHNDWQGGPWEGIPQPGENVVMQGEMEYPRYIDAPRVNHDAAHYHPPPQPVRNILGCNIESSSD